MPYPGLRFTDGTTTVTISDGSTGWLLQYEAKNKLASEPEVTEQCTILLLGGISAVRSTIESINRLFRGAQTWQKEKLGARVFVERLTESAGAWWRSEIIEALPVPEPSAMDWGVVQGKIEITLVFTRKNWWEGAEVSVPLTNGNGTNNTSGLTVYNHDDSGTGHDNWVSIAAADVAGDLPAPCKLTLKASSNDITTVWIGHNWINPTSLTHILEAEDASGGTDYSEATCSGGYYSSYSLSSGSEATMFYWSLTTSAIPPLREQYFLPLIRFRTAANEGTITYDLDDLWLRWKISCRGNTLFMSNWSYQTGECTPIFFPLAKLGVEKYYDILVTLRGKQSTGSAMTVAIDFVCLLPINSWRRLYANDVGLSSNYALIDDSIDDLTYYYYTIDDVSRTFLNKIIGSPLMLQPNTAQKLYFLTEQPVSGTNTHTIAATATVMLSYRPRKLTLN